MKPTNCANLLPQLLLEDYFPGKTKAWGVFEDRFGNVRKQFCADINGTWNGKELCLSEDFLYSDGKKENRNWTIKKIDTHRYEGTANDVIGIASGECRGNSLRWQYDMRLNISGHFISVHFTDRMYLQSDGVMLSKARISKLGVEIGVVTLTFMKNLTSEVHDTGLRNTQPTVVECELRPIQ
jgi:hypothetical protein